MPFLCSELSAKHSISSMVGNWGFYQGETNGCKCHGEGVARFHSGDITRGQFSEHRIDGLAVTVYADGSCMSGMHRNGTLHGAGVFTDSDGNLTYGNWDNGVYSGPNSDALNVAVQAETIAAGISLRLSNRNSFVGSGIGKIFQALGCISLIASVQPARHPNIPNASFCSTLSSDLPAWIPNDYAGFALRPLYSLLFDVCLDHHVLNIPRPLSLHAANILHA